MGLHPDTARTRSDFHDPISEFTFKLSRLEALARVWKIGLNPLAARPTVPPKARFYVQTFKTQAFSTTMQFETGSGCSATNGANYAIHGATSFTDFLDSNSRIVYAIKV